MSIMWHKLGDAEKQSFKNEAERLNKNATNLTQDEKCIQIQRVKKMLINNVSISISLLIPFYTNGIF